MFRSRPLALWIFAFALGVLCAVFGSNTVKILLFALCGVLCILCVIVRRFTYPAVVLPLLLAFLSGGGRFWLSDHVANRDILPCVDLEAYVTGDVTSTNMYGFVLEVSTSEKEYPLAGTQVYVYYDVSEVTVGDRVGCNLTFEQRDLTGYADGVMLSGNGSVKILEKGASHTLLSKFKQNIRGDILSRYSESVGGVSNALLTGDVTDLDPILYSAYKSAGISHILVISGFHVSLIVMTAYVVLYRTFLSRRTAGMVCTVFALVFGMFVGFVPSVVRSLIMCIAVFIGGMFNYKSDSFTSLFIALGILLIINPYSLFSVGMWLSFLCTLGIITVSPILPEKIGKKQSVVKKSLTALWESVAISLAASVFSYPVLWFVFGEFPLISPIINLFAVPLSSAATVMGYVALIISPLTYVVDIMLKLLNEIAMFADSLGFATVSTYALGMTVAAVISFGGIYIICAAKMKHRNKAFLYTVLGFTLCTVLAAGINHVMYSNVAVADTTYNSRVKQIVAVSQNQCLFIDDGGQYVKPNRVFEIGQTDVDVYIIPRCNASALRNFTSVLTKTGIKAVYVDIEDANEQAFDSLLELCGKWNVETHTFSQSAEITVGDIKVISDKKILKCKGKIYKFEETDQTVYLDGKE